MLPQGLRAFFGANFIAMAALGQMPEWAGFLHGAMHVGTGVFSLYAAVAVSKGKQAKSLVIFANLFGIVDILVTAFDISFLSFEEMGVRHSINYAVFFAAPVYFWLHILSISKKLGFKLIR